MFAGAGQRCPDHGTRAFVRAVAELMRRADLALYRAKDAGKDRWQLFDG